MAEKLWDGRFSEKTEKIVEAFTSSIDIDKRLYPYDIEGSIAHCRMLAETGIVTKEDAGRMVSGLREIREEIENGNFEFTDSLEDIHMHIESRLVEKIGDTAKKLHTARSRNDQVALDIRMFLREETRRIIALLREFRKTIVNFAERNRRVILPGFTHMQRAQPVILAHHFMAYYQMFTRDSRRFSDCLKRIDVMPLGCAALAGTTFPIDRNLTARFLEFPEISENSIDAVSDRDFILEFLAAASICMMHFSRLSEEMVLWSSSEFSFIELPDAFTTGSSIMPQKKNPDVAELVRGKTGSVFGDLFAEFTMMKGLPLSYNRDLQEDKRPLFNTVDTLSACIQVYTGMIPGIRIRKQVMKKAASIGYLNATDFADWLVTRGVPFREAHERVGKAVAFAITKNKELDELSLDELKQFAPMVTDEIYEFLTPDQAVARRTSLGGTAPEHIDTQIAAAKTAIEAENASS